MHHADNGHPGLWLIVLIVLLAVVGFALYLLAKATRGAGVPAATLGGTTVDSALELVRMRYAKGEIDRDEFLRVSADLTGAGILAGPPAASA